MMIFLTCLSFPFISLFCSYSTETVNDLAREILTVLQSGQMYVNAISFRSLLLARSG